MLGGPLEWTDDQSLVVDTREPLSISNRQKLSILLLNGSARTQLNLSVILSNILPLTVPKDSSFYGLSRE